MDIVRSKLVEYVSKRTIDQILKTGFLMRLGAILYSELHDANIDHIKYTDIDYQVFTNASQRMLDGKSPYDDEEYRYSPLVAALFIPNVLIFRSFGKLLLVSIDIICGLILFILNVHQGGNRINSKICVMLWLFNPITIAISSRGSFEPVMAGILLGAIYMLRYRYDVPAGLLFGLSVHLKMYPIIYSLSIYLYLIQHKPSTKDPTKRILHLVLKPNTDQIQFFISSAISFLIASYISYIIFGPKYIEQSFTHHMKRKDLQHNFSIYFILYHILPKYQDLLATLAFIPQLAAIIYISIEYSTDFGTNAVVKFRKLIFSMFCETFVFVSLNKVCTSQYFCWYLIYLPLILDTVRIPPKKAYKLAFYWFLSQALWLICAYLYEFIGIKSAFFATGLASFLFLTSNLLIIFQLCSRFTLTS